MNRIDQSHKLQTPSKTTICSGLFIIFFPCVWVRKIIYIIVLPGDHDIIGFFGTVIMVKFNLQSDAHKIQEHYDQHGYVIFDQVDIDAISQPFRKEFSKLVSVKYQELGLGNSVNEKTVFEKELMQINRDHREVFSHIWNASQALPSLFGMMANEKILAYLDLIGMKHPTTAWTPNVRIDCPNEDEFILSDHQDRHYNGGSENSCTVYFQINGISKEKGRLHVRPGTHKLGSVPFLKKNVRPYFFLEPGQWNQYPDIELELENNNIVIFHMDLVHSSALNRATSPRLTMQLRYSNLMDPIYKGTGWLPTYTATTTKNNTGLEPVNEKKSQHE